MPGRVSTPNEIAPREGAVLRRGLSKVAVYRDENGELRERSAVCPHLGCIVDGTDREELGLPLPRVPVRHPGPRVERPGLTGLALVEEPVKA